MNLCLPYASVYMLALGIRDVQLGFITTIGMLSQVVFGLLGGVITDKLGRRLTTAVFDFLAWCVPCVVWFAASLVGARWAFGMFLGASVINGVLQVTQNSWDCLMVEDARRDQITSIYSLVIVAGQMSAIFAPIASVLVAQYSLVPAVRILYVNAFVVMVVKLIWLYVWSHETEMGVQRMAETKGHSIWALMAGYGQVVRLIVRSPGTIFSLVISIIVGATSSVNTTFWQVLVSKKLLVPDPLLPIFAMGRSVIAMVFLFTVVPRITTSTNLKKPLLVGFGAYVVGQAILATIPGPTGGAGTATYLLLSTSLVFDGFGIGLLAMLAESLVALHVDRLERSRVMAVQRTLIMLCVSPFGWIGGVLSGLSRSLPFVLTVSVLALGAVVTLGYYRRRDDLPAMQ
jgi:MFS family permease